MWVYSIIKVPYYGSIVCLTNAEYFRAFQFNLQLGVPKWEVYVFKFLFSNTKMVLILNKVLLSDWLQNRGYWLTLVIHASTLFNAHVRTSRTLLVHVKKNKKKITFRLQDWILRGLWDAVSNVKEKANRGHARARTPFTQLFLNGCVSQQC